MQGALLAVWEVIETAQQYQMNEKVASHFERSPEWVKAAFNYAEAYPKEVDLSIQDSQAMTLTDLKRQLPNLEVFSVD